MTNKDLTSVEYTGSVKLSMEVNGKKRYIGTFYNSGTDDLFKFITLCLKRNYYSADFLSPQKIQLFKKVKDGDQTTYTKVSSVVAYTGDPLIDGSSIKFHFMIPSSYLTGEDYNVIELLAKNGETLASVDVTSETQTTQNFVLIIDWQLTFDNKS